MAPPRAPQQLRAQRTRRELLVAARDVFARQGYDGATVDDIVRAAGCSKGAYYFHFASKEETLLALLDAWVDDRSQRLGKASEGPPEAALPVLARALLWQESGWPSELLVEFWGQARRNQRAAQRVTEAYRTWEAALSRALERLIGANTQTGESAPSIAPGAILALADGLALQSSVRAAGQQPAMTRQLATALALLAQLDLKSKVA